MRTTIDQSVSAGPTTPAAVSPEVSGEMRRWLAAIQLLLGKPSPLLDAEELETLRTHMTALAEVSGRAGLSSFCSLALRIGECIRPMCRAGYIPVMTAALVRQWASIATCCLSEPRNAAHGRKLVKLMTDEGWSRPLDLAEQDSLQDGFVAMSARLVSKVELSSSCERGPQQ